MSLVHAANYLAAQGRGGDTHLVHMTSKELAAMQKLAESHGKSLTINPQTGLPEAGVLSTVLPMALGAAAAASGQWWAIPAAVALSAGATYAYTGSITKGLMAGIGAWSGGNLASGLAEAGASELAAQGANAGEAAFTSGQSAIGAGGSALPTGTIPTETGAFNTLTGTEITPQSIAQKQLAAMALPEGAAAGFNSGIQNANSLGEMSNIMRGAGAASTNPTVGQGLLQGITSPSAMGSTLMNNKMAALGVAAPLLTSALVKQQSANVPGSTAQKNPFGLKEIPRDENGKPIFNASIPAQPNPAYTPVYPDYVKNPYVSGAADGGLMSGIPGYKGSPDYGSMVEGIGEVERGLEMASKRRPLEVPNPYVEIEPDEPELRRLDPHNRARKMLEMLASSSRVKMAKGLPQSNVLGAISTDPAKVIAEQRPKESIAAEQTSQEAKEGGLMSMAEGGESHVYNPTYTDYQTTPFDMQRTMQAYNPQAMPMGLPMNQQQMVGSQGYAIDPSVMKSNAQIAAEAEAKRLAELQALQASGPMGVIESVAGIKAGGLMAGGGPANLGDYSDGGRLLSGPGDGVSDSIPATIGGKQPARLATGEFVIPARIVSELGNGSTDAGAKRLYAMMDRIKAKRTKTKNIAADTKAYKYLPA